jgi:ASC-1-like (ASCH) protein
MVHDLRRIEVRVDQPQWAALKVGDRVKVTYKIGKYTGTIWGASIQGP